MRVKRTLIIRFCVVISALVLLGLYFKGTYTSFNFVREEVGGFLNLSCLKIDIDHKARFFESSQSGKHTIYVSGGAHVLQIAYKNVYSGEMVSQSYEIYAEAGKATRISILPVTDENQNSYSGNWTLAVSSIK